MFAHAASWFCILLVCLCCTWRQCLGNVLSYLNVKLGASLFACTSMIVVDYFLILVLISH